MGNLASRIRQLTPPEPRIAFGRVNTGLHVAAGTALVASSLVGLGVRTGRLDLGGRRWVHHALYAASLVSTGAAAATDVTTRRSTWPTTAATLAILATLPATRGGSHTHAGLAAIATGVYATGMVRSIFSTRRAV